MNRPDVIARRLRMARKARSLTQADLANLANCDTKFVGKIERQERRLSVELAVAFANVLQVKPAWLLDLEE